MTTTIPSRAVGAVMSTDGKQQIAAAMVFNTAQGDKELMMSFTNKGVVGDDSADVADIRLFPGVWEGVPKLSKNITFNSEGFESYEELCLYFSGVSTTINGCRIETNNTENYDGYITLLEREPTGKKTPIKVYLTKSKTPLAGIRQETLPHYLKNSFRLQKV